MYTKFQAIEAITALQNGEYDNKELKKIGYLHSKFHLNIANIIAYINPVGMIQPTQDETIKEPLFLIDNSQRVFLLTGDMNTKVFCNLKDIPKAIKMFDDKDSIGIRHFWNDAFKHASKKLLNSMFQAAQMKFRVK